MKSIATCSMLICISLFCCKSKQDRSNHVDPATLHTWVKFDDAPGFLPTWSKENTLIYHVISDPSDLHPTNGNSSQGGEINLYTQMALISADFMNAGIEPALVKSMPEVSADGLEYTYELRTEPAWDDGTSLTLDDFIFTCKAIKCPLTNNPHAKPYWEN